MSKRWTSTELLGFGLFLLAVSFLFFILVPRTQKRDGLPLIIFLLYSYGGKWGVFGFFFLFGFVVLMKGWKRSINS